MNANQLKNLSLALFLAICLLLASVGLAALYSPQAQARPAEAPPAQAINNRASFWRFLDTSGDGTGTKNAIGSTYATTAATFYIQPPAGTVYDISRLIVTVEDSAVSGATNYGAIVITNGVVIRRVSGSTILTYTDGVSITTNTQWGRFCEVTSITTQLQARCTFGDALIRLNGDKSERLEVVLRDSMSGLDGQYFLVQGFVE